MMQALQLVLVTVLGLQQKAPGLPTPEPRLEPLAAALAALDGLQALKGLAGLEGLAGLAGLEGLDGLEEGLEGLDGLAGLDALDVLDVLDGAVAPDEQDPADSLWRAARRALNRGEYAGAADLFVEITRRYPSSSRAADAPYWAAFALRSEEHTSELQSHHDLVCRLLLEKKK